MTLEEEKVNHNEWVRWLLNEDHKAELWKILEYWEKIKNEWEIKRKEFWSKHDREDFLKLLKYKATHEKYLERKYEYLNKMDGMMREKYTREYLRNDMLYNGKIEKEVKMSHSVVYEDRIKRWFNLKKWEYLNAIGGSIWVKEAKVLAENLELLEGTELNLFQTNIWVSWIKLIAENLKLKEWVRLNLYSNNILDKWAEALSHMELASCVKINLYNNHIWDKWAVSIAKNMKLKEWVDLELYGNEIWDVWAEALSHMELKEWVTLNLWNNKIWDEWAKAIMKNMELKDWVVLHFNDNPISSDVKDQLRAWVQWYKDRWIYCDLVLTH